MVFELSSWVVEQQLVQNRAKTNPLVIRAPYPRQICSIMSLVPTHAAERCVTFMGICYEQLQLGRVDFASTSFGDRR
jgi:hypothetical protein